MFRFDLLEFRSSNSRSQLTGNGTLFDYLKFIILVRFLHFLHLRVLAFPVYIVYLYTCSWMVIKYIVYGTKREAQLPLHTSFSARSLIVHFTEHHICCTAIELYNRLAKLSASKPCDILTLSWIGHSRLFQVILVGAGRNPERCVVVMCN